MPEEDSLPAAVLEEGDEEPDESAGAPLAVVPDVPEDPDEPDVLEVSDEPDEPAGGLEGAPGVAADVAGAAEDSVALGGGGAAAEESVAPGIAVLPAAAGALDEPEDCGVAGVAWLEGGVSVADSVRCLQANKAGMTRNRRARRFMVRLLSQTRDAWSGMHFPRLAQAG